MSWSISAEGTVEEIRARVHEHEREYWRGMPLAERLAVHHLVGHAVEHMAEDAKADPTLRWVLTGGGQENAPGHGYGGNYSLQWDRAPDPTA